MMAAHNLERSRDEKISRKSEQPPFETCFSSTSANVPNVQIDDDGNEPEEKRELGWKKNSELSESKKINF